MQKNHSKFGMYRWKRINKNQLNVIYGGSVNKKNAVNILNIKNNDGIFIGRSAISAKDFLDICKMIL